MIAWSLLLFPALATTADESTYLAKKASPCKKGEHAVGRAPFWWHSCKGQSGACPQSCGTCKKPNYSQTPAGQEPTCMCAGANQACTAECGYPGMVTKKNCAPIPCQQDDPVAAGCIDLEGNCGAGKSSLCVDAQGTQAECTFPATYSSSSPCQAFCREILGTDKCPGRRGNRTAFSRAFAASRGDAAGARRGESVDGSRRRRRATRGRRGCDVDIPWGCARKDEAGRAASKRR